MSKFTLPIRLPRPNALVCALGLFCAASSPLWAGPQEPSFRADVSLVLLHVAVIDPRGGDVPPLTADDFTIFDDNVEREIELFVTPSDAPLDVAMVLDSSASMRPVESSARRAALAFLGRLSPDDCIYVLPFSDSPSAGRWGRAGDPQLRTFIGSIEASGGTALHDAVLEGLAQLERANANDLVSVAAEAEEGVMREPDGDEAGDGPGAPRRVKSEPETVRNGAETIVLPPRRTSLLQEVDSAVRNLDLSTPAPVRGCGEPLPEGERPSAANARRKALLLLSDGADMDSRASFYDALGAARTASVPVFPVAMGYARDDVRLSDHLREIARATGGRMIENTQPGQLGESYDQVVALLRSFYLIGYDPGSVAGAAAPRWHDVRVDLRRPNFEPLVRPGYYR
jgi:hypothetical protein